MIVQTGPLTFATTARGVNYHAQLMVNGRWVVLSHRIALGPRHIGGSKWFNTLDELEAGVKAFKGLASLNALDKVQASH